MECAEARDRILKASLDDDVRAHLRECEACAALAADEGRLARALSEADGNVRAADGGDFDALLGAIQTEDETVRGKLRSLPTASRVAVAFAATIVMALIFVVGWRRGDWDAYPMFRMATITGSFLVSTAIGVVLALPRIYRPVRPAAFRLGMFAFLLAVAFVPAMLPAAHEVGTAQAAGFWPGIGRCLGLGTIAAIPAIVVVRMLQRDDLSLWSTLFLALSAAIGAHLALQMHCPVVDPMHIAIAHSGLAIVYVVCAWLVVLLATRREFDAPAGNR